MDRGGNMNGNFKWKTKEEQAQELEKQAAEVLKKENEIKELREEVKGLEKRVKTLEKNYGDVLKILETHKLTSK